MSNATQLLAMLEPAVRPGGVPGPTRAVTPPIESASFESLLEQAKATAAASDPKASTETEPVAPVDPLKALARVDLIDNAALLRIIGGSNRA